MKPLTERQLETLQAIAHFWRMGCPPTTGELKERLHLKTESGLSDLLRPLRDKGYITVAGGVRGRQRLIELTAPGRAQSGLGVPVLGEIPAGTLAQAIQSADEWLDDVGTLLELRPDDFLLRVAGDSMIGEGIRNGDYVQVRPGIKVHSGDIVAAQICDESSGDVSSTLKFLDFVEGAPTVKLRAANPDYPTREFDATCVSVAGVYRGLVRVVK